MKKEKMYPTDEIKVKDEFAPYVTFEDMPGGHKTYIKVPNKYDVELSVYNLIPGTSVIITHSYLNDYFTKSDELLEYEHPEDNLLINFIDSGSYRCEVSPNKYAFVKNNYLSMYKKNMLPNSFSYVGEVTIVHIIINKKQMPHISDYFKDIREVINYFFDVCENENAIIFKTPEKILNIVEEIKEFDFKKDKSKRLLFILKTLESLLFLYEIEIENEKIDQRTYSDETIRVVRYIKNSLSRNIASYVSLETLSMSYGINLTTLKNCFKDMYGKPLYTWYKEYKFYRAKELIKNTDYPISKIAYMVGYKSSSKFTKAFKKEMGVLPSSYRKNKK